MRIAERNRRENGKEEKRAASYPGESGARKDEQQQSALLKEDGKSFIPVSDVRRFELADWSGKLHRATPVSSFFLSSCLSFFLSCNCTNILPVIIVITKLLIAHFVAAHFLFLRRSLRGNWLLSSLLFHSLFYSSPSRAKGRRINPP